MNRGELLYAQSRESYYIRDDRVYARWIGVEDLCRTDGAPSQEDAVEAALDPRAQASGLVKLAVMDKAERQPPPMPTGLCRNGHLRTATTLRLNRAGKGWIWRCLSCRKMEGWGAKPKAG